MTEQPLVLPKGDWTLMPHPRVPPAIRASLGRITRGVLWITRRKAGETTDLNVFLTFARLGKLFPAHAVFLSQILGNTRLSAAEKELVVLRVAWRLGCAYEYSHHHHMASELGVPTAQMQAATGNDLHTFDRRTAALLTATDELLDDQKLTTAGWDALAQECTPDEALELAMFVGHYVMVAMVINTAGMQPEPHFAVVDPLDGQ